MHSKVISSDIQIDMLCYVVIVLILKGFLKKRKEKLSSIHQRRSFEWAGILVANN